MKKNILKLLLVLLLMPIFINASTFSESTKIVNDYCNQVDADGRYLRCKDSLDYGYKNNKITVTANFKKGGLLNESEFKISKTNKVNNKAIDSYLAPGVSYWLIDGSNKAIDTAITTTDNAGTRPTEYVRHFVKATGTGTRENAWEFEDIYKVTLSVVNKGGNVVDDIKFVNKNGSTTLSYTTNNGFTVSNVTCSGISAANVDTSTYNVVKLNNINKDTDCRITFEKLTKAQVVYNYYKESLNKDGYDLYYTKQELYKEGTKVSIDTAYTPIKQNSSDKEEYVVNKKKGKYTGYATIDNTLVLDIYYDLVNVLDVTANVTGVKDAQSGQKVVLKVNLKNRKNTSVEVTLKDELIKAAKNNNKIKDLDSTLTSILGSGLVVTLSAHENRNIEYSFTVNEVPGKQIKSQLSYTVKDRETVLTTVISIGIEKIISLVERNNNTPGANVVIVLDISGSMDSTVYDSNNKPDGTRLSHAKAAIQDFIAEAYNDKENTKIRVTTFGSSAKNYGIIAKDSSTAATLRTSVKDISSSGNTRYDLGLQKAYESLFTESENLKSSWPNNQPIVIFLSDGEPWPTSCIKDIPGKVKQLTDKNTDIYTIGYGKLNGTAITQLEDIATSYVDEKGKQIKRFFKADPTNVSSIFSQIYRLVDTLNDRLTTGGFVRISSNAIVNASKPLKIKCGSTELKYNSLDALASSQYGKKENGIYYVDAAKFDASSKVEVTYFIPDA